MQTIALDNVVVSEERIRRHFDEAAIAELAESIAQHGLLHAPVLHVTDDSNPAVLIAGERRLRAIRSLAAAGVLFKYNNEQVPPGRLPYTTMRDLAPSEAYAVELEENIIRRDISWQERVAAEARLHELRTLENPEHTIADTAAVIFGDSPTAHETHQTKINVLLADHLSDPEIAGAKNEHQAAKIARRKMEALFVNELAARTEVKASDHKLLAGSCLDLLATIPANSVDCMVTDPPYGIDAHTFTKQSNAVDGVQHIYDDSYETAAEIVSAIAHATCLKQDAHVWLFCDIRHYHDWAATFSEAGWYVWPHPIVWDKQGVGALLGDANGPRHTYELILFAQRGRKKISKVFADVLAIRADVNKDHAAQKPTALYSELINFSCVPGETVLDPCAGSGTIFRAATASKVKAIGIELDQQSINLCRLAITGDR